MSITNPQTGAMTPPLPSMHKDDPEMADLLELFVQDLDNRIASLREAFSQTDFDRLRTLAHQLKGAASGYGYPAISESAATLEQTVLAQEAEASAVSEKVQDLITLCKRAV